MLDGRYRALDLTDERGAFCGKMLAELGVDVIKVEPPAGSAERRRGPFYHDEPHHEHSLYWLAYNAGKRGITLNLESADGRVIFRRLAAAADFVVESFAPGYLDGLGLGHQGLSATNPRLILTSITPFGQSGPYAGFAADDLTLLALSGVLNLNGDRDRAPLRFAMEQSFPHAGAHAAASTMIAHQHRQLRGRGQHLDVSMQQALTHASWLQYQNWFHAREIPAREGANTRRGEVLLRVVWPCRDGYVAWRLFVAAQGSKTRALTDWMAEAGMAGATAGVDWAALDMNDLGQAEVDRWDEAIGAFFLRHTKAELHRGAVERGIMLFPMNDALDLLHDEHLAAREFWAPVEHPALGAALTLPARPYRSTLGPPAPLRPAPRLGEHNAAIYQGELGLAEAELTALKSAGVI